MMTMGIWRALQKFSAPGEEPVGRPKWTRRSTINYLLGGRLIEEVSPGLYRRTEAGEEVVRAWAPRDV
jgi:hypothetical protein